MNFSISFWFSFVFLIAGKISLERKWSHYGYDFDSFHVDRPLFGQLPYRPLSVVWTIVVEENIKNPIKFVNELCWWLGKKFKKKPNEVYRNNFLLFWGNDYVSKLTRKKSQIRQEVHNPVNYLKSCYLLDYQQKYQVIFLDDLVIPKFAGPPEIKITIYCF